MAILKKCLFFALCCAAWSVANAGDPPIPEDKAIFQFKTKTGIVTFRHQHHADLSFTTCKTCHHTFEGEGEVKACSECHDKKKKQGDAIKLKKAFHNRCTGCHQYTMEERGIQAGPLKKKCKLCHIKQ